MPTRLAKMVSFSMRVRPRLAAQSIGDLRRFLDSDSISRFTRSVKQPIRDSTAAAGAIYFPRTQWPEEPHVSCCANGAQRGRSRAGHSPGDSGDRSVGAGNETDDRGSNHQRFDRGSTVLHDGHDRVCGGGLLLTLTGLAVVVARPVVERQHEMAIRSALGATRPRPLEMVLSRLLFQVPLARRGSIASLGLSSFASPS